MHIRALLQSRGRCPCPVVQEQQCTSSWCLAIGAGKKDSRGHPVGHCSQDLTGTGVPALPPHGEAPNFSRPCSWALWPCSLSPNKVHYHASSSAFLLHRPARLLLMQDELARDQFVRAVYLMKVAAVQNVWLPVCLPGDRCTVTLSLPIFSCRPPESPSWPTLASLPSLTTPSHSATHSWARSVVYSFYLHAAAGLDLPAHRRLAYPLGEHAAELCCSMELLSNPAHSGRGLVLQQTAITGKLPGRR
jgi:hypothetical protein